MNERERLMAVLLCGVLTGSVFFFLTQITLGLFGSSFLAALQSAPTSPKMPSLVFLGLDALMGVWVIWLYSRLSHARPGHITAVSVGTAWWAVKCLQSGKWVGLGFTPASGILAPLFTSYCASLGAVLIGAFLFDRVRLAALLAPAPVGAEAMEGGTAHNA
jgi:hypothetical protein